MEVKGRDLVAGLPKTITLTSQEVREAQDIVAHRDAIRREAEEEGRVLLAHAEERAAVGILAESDSYVNRLFVVHPLHSQRHLIAGFGGFHRVHQGLGIVNLFPVHGGDPVACFQTSRGRGAIFGHSGQMNAAHHFHTLRKGNTGHHPLAHPLTHSHLVGADFRHAPSGR